MKKEIKARLRALQLKSVSAHRNGVGGDNNYVVHFKDGGAELIGIVFTETDDDGYASKLKRQTTVINPLDISECFYGYDWYGPWLLDEVKKYEKRLHLRHLR